MVRRPKVRPAAILLAVVVTFLHPTLWGEERSRYRRTVAHYDVPDVSLLDQDGARVRLPQVLTTEKPVIVNFVFTTCSTICPVLSASFSSLEKTLGPRAGEVRMVSIATDPDHDTPEVLRTYRERFDAGPEWEFLTGSRQDIDRVLKAFGAYSQNKMTHRPLNLLRAAGSDSWVRIDGLIAPSDLLAEYRGLSR